MNLSFVFFCLTSYINKISLFSKITSVIAMRTSITKIISIIPISTHSQLCKIASIQQLTVQCSISLNSLPVGQSWTSPFVRVRTDRDIICTDRFLYVQLMGQLMVTFFGSSWQTYFPLLLQRPFTHLPSCPYVSPPGKWSENSI